MNPRVIEINKNNRHLNLYRGFMRVMESKVEVGRVAISDIGTLIINAHGISYSNDLIVALSKAKIPVVVSGSNFMPVGWFWPIDGNSIQAKRMDAQIACKKPLKKRLWQQIVVAKVKSQAAVLGYLNKPTTPLLAMISHIRSGDPQNIEATAAQRYWTLLFGKQFRRNRELNGINAALNYGYTIMRSAIARAICGAGLHPTISVSHQNKYNAYRLVDDLIEPFRALIDHQVYQLNELTDTVSVTPEVKENLVNILYQSLKGPRGSISVLNATYEVAHSLADVFQNPEKKLWLPENYLFKQN